MSNDNVWLLKIRRVIVGLLGVSFVIVLHEFGHFIFCKFFGVGTPTFSIGFGPAILQKRIGDTIFQIAAIPLGGYVSINQYDFAQIAYFKKMLIISAGVIFNIIFGLAVLYYLKLKKAQELQEYREYQVNLEDNKNSEDKPAFIGPVGIINLMGTSLETGFDVFLYQLAVISLNIGFFNILPIPFFDGGQAVQITVEALTNKSLSPFIESLVYGLFFVLLIILMIFLSYRDILGLNKKK